MSYISVNLDDVQEAKPAAAGIYPLRIVKCDVTQASERAKIPGADQFKVSIGFIDEPDTPNITHYISLPHEQDEDGGKFKALLLKRFLHAFNVPYNADGIDTEEMAMQMVGAEGNCEVTLSDPDDNGNVYNRLRVPRLPNESSRR